MNIAVVNGGSNLVAFVRMDNIYLSSINIASKKAKTITAKMLLSNTPIVQQYHCLFSHKPKQQPCFYERFFNCQTTALHTRYAFIHVAK